MYPTEVDKSIVLEPDTLTPGIARALIEKGEAMPSIESVISKIDSLLQSELKIFIDELVHTFGGEQIKGYISRESVSGVMTAIGDRLRHVVEANLKPYEASISFRLIEVTDQFSGIMHYQRNNAATIEEICSMYRLNLKEGQLALGLFRNKTLPYHYELRFCVINSLTGQLQQAAGQEEVRVI